MLLQLRSGHTIEISIEAYLDMSDQDIQDLECLSPGQLMEINNPFYKPFSSKTKQIVKDPKDPHALHNVTDEEKLEDMYDYDREDI
tara:strand:- start:590 stop:847 length:258 start_codon:yes stop_codon:yes gene_type:complete